MLRSLLLLFVYVAFLGLSASAPFVAALGYVWVDTFQPQAVAYIILDLFPVAKIMGAVAFFGYLALDRRSPPPVTLQTVLHIGMAFWVTGTLIWAQAPDMAWEKWDWVFKTLAFSAFVPYAIRSRVQIEAFVLVYVFSLAANFVPFGIKVLISGGGYGVNLGLQQGNTGLSEGGLLSTACLMTVPLTVFLFKHGRLLPPVKAVRLGYLVVAALAIATAIGTYERSALIGLVVLAGYMWVRTRHKIGFGIVVAIAACFILYTASSAWNDRISTVGNYEKENSAYTRILVWRWTMEFIASHPLGGGFQTYVINHVEVPGVGGEAAHMEFGRAFHSIYFEVLGEHGYPGIAIFLTLAGTMFMKLRRIARRARAYPELQWVVALADALQSGLAVFMTSGAFVGIAFQPMFWYTIALGISLSAYMWRAERLDPAGPAGWRTAVNGPDGPSGVAGWRKPPAAVLATAASPRTISAAATATRGTS
jgi:putative inorganic carbon (HCO3(-)) transporter